MQNIFWSSIILVKENVGQNKFYSKRNFVEKSVKKYGLKKPWSQKFSLKKINTEKNVIQKIVLVRNFCVHTNVGPKNLAKKNLFR